MFHRYHYKGIYDKKVLLGICEDQQKYIYLKGLGNVPPIPFPPFIQLSELIRLTIEHDPTKGSPKNPIHIDYPYLTIHRFRDMVLTLPTAARDDNGNPVDIAAINLNTLFINSLVKEGLKDLLPPISVKGNEIISTFLSLSYFLGLYPITNALSFFIADRIYPHFFDIYKDNSIPFTTWEYQILSNNLTLSGFTSAFPNNSLPQDLLEIIAKHIILKHFDQYEFTILDYLGLYGQPPIINGELNLGGNNITILTGFERIYSLHGVFTLNLQNNRILGPLLHADQFIPLVRLRNLNLKSNTLISIPPTTFLALGRLRALNLSDNLLSSLSPEVFNPLTQLEVLNLSNNLLTTLTPEIFYPLTQLNTLIISYNSLSDLPENIFHTLPNLQILNLHWNNLRTIPENTFVPLYSLRKLVVSLNKIRGDEQDFRIKHRLSENVELDFSIQREQFAYLEQFFLS